MTNAIKIAAYDTLGLTKVYKVIENGVVMGTVTKTIDHRLNARDQRISVATWAFSSPVGHCDGYRTRAEAVDGLLEMLDIAVEAATVYEDDVVVKKVSVAEYAAMTGTKPVGTNRWAFKIIGANGAMIRMAAEVGTINPACKAIREWAMENLAVIREQVGALRAIVLAA